MRLHNWRRDSAHLTSLVSAPDKNAESASMQGLAATYVSGIKKKYGNKKRPRRSGAYWEGNGPETVPARVV